MRKFSIAIGLALVTASALLPAASAGAFGSRPAGGPADNPARGLVHRDLREARATGPCPSGFELGDPASGRCTHGPDPAPAGVDVRRVRSVAELAAETASTPAETAAGIACIDDGTSGNRVQAIYAVASNRTDRFATVAPLIPVWAANVDAVFAASAAETGGERHVRWVTNPDCTLNVLRVVLSPTGDDSIDNTESELAAKGFNRSDRKYLVWTDDTLYCGIAGIYGDDRPTQDNRNNGVARVPALVGRVDSGCWGRTQSVEAHELVHMLGGVQLSAPNATAGWHCDDEYDRMCYKDDPSTILTYVCPSSHEALLDCGHDDYFSTAPAAGSYLATHWNTADSSFLSSSATVPVVSPPPPAPDTTPPPVPGGLTASPGTEAVGLSWNAVSAPDLAGYRLLRNGAPVYEGASTAFTDTGLTGGVTYTYTVSASDAVGNRSAESAPVGAVPGSPAVVPATSPPPAAPATTGGPAVTSTGGYRLVGADGRSFGFGESGPLGSTGALPVDPAAPVVDAAATPDGTGAWAVTAAGAVLTLGPARHLGSLAGARLNRPIVGIAATPSGNGYWLVASDGGIFAFGDARFLGSTGAIKLNQPIV
ncbi:MAG: hypothetical protein ACT4PX_00775, partial [Actinomycetota bacterium]